MFNAADKHHRNIPQCPRMPIGDNRANKNPVESSPFADCVCRARRFFRKLDPSTNRKRPAY